MIYYVLPEQMPAGCSSCELLSNCSDCEGLPCYCQIDKDDKGFPIHKFRDFGAYDPVPDKRPDWCRLRPVGLSSTTMLYSEEGCLSMPFTEMRLKFFLVADIYLERFPDARIAELLQQQAQIALNNVNWAEGVAEYHRRCAEIKAKGGPEK